MAEHAGILSSSPAPAVHEANQMEDLPDDVLLLLLSLLPLEDVIRCRLVCKRLALLAVHPDVWRRVTLHGYGTYHRPRTPAAVLHVALLLAPCVDGIDVQLPSAASCALLFTAACAARTLHISAYGGAGAWQAALFIRRQGSLGRLREINLHLCSPTDGEAEPTDGDAALLFGTLASTPGLDLLHVWGDHDEGDFIPWKRAPTCIHSAGTASLTRLYFLMNNARLERVFNCLLAAHADTLREIEIVCLHPWSRSPATTHLLAKLPNLTKLECQMLPDMEALAACDSLRTLKLLVDPLLGPARREATAAFFRRAHQLVTVCISAHLPCALEYVSALASSRRSRVERLRIKTYSYPDERAPEPSRLQGLLSALPKLPALRQLEMTLDKDSDAARTLLEANPSLDVHLDSYFSDL